MRLYGNRYGKPAELPIEQPTEFELVISLKTVKAPVALEPRGSADRWSASLSDFWPAEAAPGA